MCYTHSIDSMKPHNANYAPILNTDASRRHSLCRQNVLHGLNLRYAERALASSHRVCENYQRASRTTTH